MNSVIWLLISILLFVFEALTTTLVCIWFALGALAAFITSLFSLNNWWCISIFILVSVITLISTRKYALTKFNKNTVPTNADALVGKPAIVTEEINNITSTGSVLVCGQHWSATARIGQNIKKGELVEIVAISGVKLVVVPSGNPLSTIGRPENKVEGKIENNQEV